MYYSRKNFKSKALIVCLLSAVIVCFSTVCAYAYDRVYVYTSADFGMETSLFSGTVLAKLSNVKRTYVLNVSPRNTNYSSSVTIDYSSLSDLVYYCNEHGLNATLTYNNAVGKYLAFVQDYEFSVGSFSNISVVGCLGNSDGSIYLADRDSSGGSGSDTSVDLSGVLSALGNIQSKLSNISSGVSGISEKVYGIMVYFFNLDNFITSRLIPYTDTLMTNTSHIESYVSWIDDTTKSIDTRLSAVALKLDALQSSSDAIEEDTGLILEKVCGIYSQNDIIIAKLDDIKEIDSATLTLLKSYLASYQTAFDSITFAVSEVSKKTTSVDTTLTDFYSHMQSLDSFGGRIWTFLTNENGPIQAIAINAYYIREKLDNLTATCTHDDTDILNLLGGVQSLIADNTDTLSLSISRLIPVISTSSGDIVAAVNNLASLFSLGETQTIEVGNRGSFDKSWDVTSVKFAVVTPDGFVIFSSAEGYFLNGNFSLPQLLPDGYGYMSWYEVASACTALTFSGCDGSGDTNISGTVTLFDASGRVIALAVGDRIQPTATLYQWEVVRQNGQVIPIASSKFTYDTAGMDGVFSSFGELFPPVIMVPAADLIAMPSLFSSSYRQIVSLYDDFHVVVCNCSDSALTIEYVTPSSLLNWYANRQNDFRYWLDTKLNSLSVGAPTDLSTLETKLDSIETTLSSDTYFSPVITSVDAVGLNIESLNASFNTNIGSLLDKLDIVIEGTSESVENRINVTIDASNDAYNVFYITGEDGETESVTEFTGDLTKASGRLLSLLYRLVFADALSTVDGDLDGFEDFFTSQGDDTATQSIESPYEEENVWLAS